MTALVWDQVGERRFDTGVDRGVLFLQNGNVLPWNGLTAVSENLEREVKSFYLDGVKYLDHQVLEEFSGKLSAFTYPDELDEVMGSLSFGFPGVFFHDQSPTTFGLSYRTQVGNDVDGTDHGYKIHIVYNVLATPATVTNSTMANSNSPVLFEWQLVTTPPDDVFGGLRPTSHVSIHSRSINPDLLSDIEDRIYGTEVSTPELPSLSDLVAMAEDYYGPPR